MSVFSVDFDSLLSQLLPVRLRKTRMIAWLKCLVAPTKWLNGLFMVNRAANLYRLAHDSQVCYLQAVLNDVFDNTLRRIFIDDPVYLDPLFLYLDDEEKTVYIDLDSEIGTAVIGNPDPVPLYTDAEIAVSGSASFIVDVPVALGLSIGAETHLKALVNLYRLPGTSYSIKYF